MNDQITNGIIAIALGGVVCVLLFVPFVALSYRRRGRLTPGRVLLWIGAAVYGWAIWTYTLLPLPEGDDYRCVGKELNPMSLVDEIHKAIASGHPLTSPHLLQIVFNVLLFLPLGFFLRVLGGRGFIVATLVGFGTSLFIELTQLTGVWGVFHCAYRLFDVGDLITNTLGAALGAIIALVVPARARGAEPSAVAQAPRPVTKGRRLLAFICDGLGFMLVSVGITTVITIAYALLTENTDVPGWASNIGLGVAIALWSIVILVSGQSIGDKAVQLRYAGGAAPVLWQRIARIVGGIVGYHLVALVPFGGETWSMIFVLVAIIMVFSTKKGRGLPGVLAAQQLTDARSAASADTPDPARS